jgi:hypothetical protein
MSLWDGLPISEPLQIALWAFSSYGLFLTLYLITKRSSLSNEEKRTIFAGLIISSVVNLIFTIIMAATSLGQNSNVEFDLIRLTMLIGLLSPWIIGTTALALLLYLKTVRSDASQRTKSTTRNILLVLSGINFSLSALVLFMAYAWSFADMG